ncbi:MAG: hypothetical protein FWG66_04170 [Spirochaetes bacterium]|nr:hypothetical protein [Spirochaetota bacterium]
MKAGKIVEDFGALFIDRVWDNTVDTMGMIIDGKMKSERAQKLYAKINALDDNAKGVIKEVIMEAIGQNTFNVLQFFEEEEEYIIGFNGEEGITDLKELSDGLAGELYSEDGWIEKYSKTKIE